MKTNKTPTKKVKKMIAQKRRKPEVSPVEGPGPRILFDKKDISREERVEKMKVHKVLNGRVF